VLLLREMTALFQAIEFVESSSLNPEEKNSLTAMIISNNSLADGIILRHSDAVLKEILNQRPLPPLDPIVAAVQPGNYFKSFGFIEPFPSYLSFIFLLMNLI
jgi:hypothetical protein